MQEQKNKITNEQNKSLTQTISLREIKNIIFQVEKCKSSGIYGLPIEFCKAKYKILKHDLSELYNSILFQGENLTYSMNQIIIAMIPKND